MKKAGILIALIMVLASCGTSYLKTSENVSKEKNVYSKVVVVGRISDQTSRIKFENEVVRFLGEQGVNAIPSHQVPLTRTIKESYTESEIQSLEGALLQQGFDGSIVTNFLDSSQYQEVVPGNSNTYYYPRVIGRFGRGYGYYPMSTWQPDQIEVGVKYSFQSALYKLGSDKAENLQWIGKFEVKDPYNIDAVVSDYAAELVQALMEQSIQP